MSANRSLPDPTPSLNIRQRAEGARLMLAFASGFHQLEFVTGSLFCIYRKIWDIAGHHTKPTEIRSYSAKNSSAPPSSSVQLFCAFRTVQQARQSACPMTPANLRQTSGSLVDSTSYCALAGWRAGDGRYPQR
jgi:hypothetical protein